MQSEKQPRLARVECVSKGRRSPSLMLTHISEPQARMEKGGSVFYRAVRLRVGF